MSSIENKRSLAIDGSDLKCLVSEVLLTTDSLGSAAIVVEEANGIITLSGIVESEEASMMAEAAAREQPGVVNVINNLKYPNL